LRRCPACKLYTLRQSCPKCGKATVSPHPLAFSPFERWAKQRVYLKQRA
jgi:H/ACA ribonucleoprotein complex subunit 3